MTDLYLVRHAQPKKMRHSILLSAFSRFRPKVSALSNTGKAQALITAHYLNRFSANILLASPVPRALETAKFISESLNLEIQVRADLKEQSVGPLLKTVRSNDIPKLFPVEWQQWQSGDPTYCPPGGEPTGAFLARVDRFLAEMEDKSGTVIAVTHFGFIQGVVCRVLGLPFRYSMPLDFGEASITYIQLGGNERVLVALNEINHWEIILGIRGRNSRVSQDFLNNL